MLDTWLFFSVINKNLIFPSQSRSKLHPRAIKRNIERFPEDFMFQLTKAEWKNLVFQNGISTKQHGGRRFMPYAFTVVMQKEAISPVPPPQHKEAMDIVSKLNKYNYEVITSIAKTLLDLRTKAKPPDKAQH